MGELFARLSHLRHASVHRVVTSIESIKKMMIDAVELADVLKDFPRRNKLRCIELAIYDVDLESLQRITHQPVEAFVDFNYPGCQAGSICDTARRAQQYALEAPRAMAPMFPVAQALSPALVRKMPQHKRKGPLSAGSIGNHPASNNHSQVRTRDRNAPYPKVRDFIKKSINHLIDLTGDGEIDLGLVGVSKNNPVDLTIDRPKDKSLPTTIKSSGIDEFQGKKDSNPLGDVKAEDAISAIGLGRPTTVGATGTTRFAANNFAQVQKTGPKQQQQQPHSSTGFGGVVQKPAKGGLFSQIQGKPVDGAFGATNTEQAQNTSNHSGQQNYEHHTQVATGFAGVVGGKGLFSQIYAKPTGTPPGGQFNVGTQQPDIMESLFRRVSENHRPNLATSKGANSAAKNPQTAQGQRGPFLTQVMSMVKRAPTALISRFRTPSPLPEGNFVPALRQTSGNIPRSSTPDAHREVDTKVGSQFENFRTQVANPDDSD